MKKLIVYYGDAPVYAEGFSKECKRSCKGALHILPKKPMEVTEDEYNHLLKKYAYMGKKLRHLCDLKEEKAEVEAKHLPDPPAPEVKEGLQEKDKKKKKKK